MNRNNQENETPNPLATAGLGAALVGMNCLVPIIFLVGLVVVIGAIFGGGK